MLLLTLVSGSWIIWNIEARHFLFRKLDSFVPFQIKRKSRRIENRDANTAESDAFEFTDNTEACTVVETGAEYFVTEDQTFKKPQSVVTLTVKDGGSRKSSANQS